MTWYFGTMSWAHFFPANQNLSREIARNFKVSRYLARSSPPFLNNTFDPSLLCSRASPFVNAEAEALVNDMANTELIKSTDSLFFIG